MSNAHITSTSLIDPSLFDTSSQGHLPHELNMLQPPIDDNYAGSPPPYQQMSQATSMYHPALAQAEADLYSPVSSSQSADIYNSAHFTPGAAHHMENQTQHPTVSEEYIPQPPAPKGLATCAQQSSPSRGSIPMNGFTDFIGAPSCRNNEDYHHVPLDVRDAPISEIDDANNSTFVGNEQSIPLQFNSAAEARRYRYNRNIDRASGGDSEKAFNERLKEIPNEQYWPRYVEQIMVAMADMETDLVNQTASRNFHIDRHPKALVEMCAWNLMEMTVNRHLYGPLRATWSYKYREPKQLTFKARFEAIIYNLTQCKLIAKHVLDIPYVYTFVDDPDVCKKKVEINKVLNKRKAGRMQLGKEAEEELKAELAKAEAEAESESQSLPLPLTEPKQLQLQKSRRQPRPQARPRPRTRSQALKLQQEQQWLQSLSNQLPAQILQQPEQSFQQNPPSYYTSNAHNSQHQHQRRAQKQEQSTDRAHLLMSSSSANTTRAPNVTPKRQVEKRYPSPSSDSPTTGITSSPYGYQQSYMSPYDSYIAVPNSQNTQPDHHASFPSIQHTEQGAIEPSTMYASSESKLPAFHPQSTSIIGDSSYGDAPSHHTRSQQSRKRAFDQDHYYDAQYHDGTNEHRKRRCQ